MPYLIKALTTENYPAVQYESAKILYHLSQTAQQHEIIVRNGFVPVLIGLLKSKHANVAEKSLEVIRVLVENHPDLVLETDLLPTMLALIDESTTSIGQLKAIVKLVSTICQLKPIQPPSCTETENLYQIVFTLEQLIQHEDPEILCHTMQSIVHLIEADSEWKASEDRSPNLELILELNLFTGGALKCQVRKKELRFLLAYAKTRVRKQ